VQAGATDAVVELGLNHPPLTASDAWRVFQAGLAGLAARPDLSALVAYPPEGGHAGHREAGAAWIARAGLEAAPERVLVCSGSQHGLTTVLATCLKPGDLVLTEALTYPGLKAVASLLQLRLQGLSMDGDGLRPDALAAACRNSDAKALYCVPTIQNPTTSVMSEGRRQEIAELARAHGLIIVEDDIHALLPEARPRPIAAFAPERSYYITSTSKTLAPGLRVGYVLAAPGSAERLAAGIRATTWAVCPSMAELVSLWIRDGTADGLVQQHRREAAARQALARRILADAEYEAHPNGYHLWLKLPEPWRSETFVAAARHKGVKVTPSQAFVVGRGSAPDAVRVCLGSAPSHADLERGLHVVAEVLRSSPMDGFPI
jgi:DNA-binding transcriptional MocR family regulator